MGPTRGNVSSVPGGRRGPIRSQASAVASALRASSTRAGAPQLAIARVISAETARPTSPVPTASWDHNLSERTPSTGPAVAAGPMSYRCGRSSHFARVCASDLSLPTKTSSSSCRRQIPQIQSTVTGQERHHQCQALMALASSLSRSSSNRMLDASNCANRSAPDLTCVSSPHARLQFWACTLASHSADRHVVSGRVAKL